MVGGSPVETLVSGSGEQLEFDIDSGQLRLDPPLLVAQDWKLSQPLRACLGPPLAQPPAQDVAGFRKLILTGREGSWMLELSGRSVCGLEGRVLLDLGTPKVDTSGLEVQGTPWKEGGLELARARLAAATLPEGVTVP